MLALVCRTVFEGDVSLPKAPDVRFFEPKQIFSKVFGSNNVEPKQPGLHKCNNYLDPPN